MPKESDANTPSMDAAIVAIKVAFLRVIFNSSEKKATTTSSNEMVEVSAATASKIKKIEPKNPPPNIFWKMPGRVMNTKLGPLLGSIPKANTAGNIITPARMAIRVSERATETAVDARFSCLPKYEE